MEKEVNHDRSKIRLKLLIYLISIETMIAGIVTAISAARQGSVTITGVASVIAIAGAISLIVPKMFSEHLNVPPTILDILQIWFIQFIPATVIFVITILLFSMNLSTKVAWILFPLLFWFWLVGVEYLLFFPVKKTAAQIVELDIRQKRLAFLSLLFAFGIVAIPSHIPSLLDGIPWETPFEFVLVILLLPFTFITGKRFLAKGVVVSTLGFLFTLKIIAMLFLPQTGLGIRAFSSQETLASGNWEKSYSTFLNPLYTQVIQQPYLSNREFPIEWINHKGFEPEQFWVALEVNGFVHLKENERLVFIVEGARQAQVEMIDVVNQKTTSAIILENYQRVGANLFQAVPNMRDFKLQGILTFKRFGQYHVEPLILYPDGSTKSALTLSRIWVSPTNINFSFFQLLLNFIGLSLAGIFVIGLVFGLVDLYRSNKISAIDVYLAATALPAFYIANLIPKSELNIAIIYLISVLAVVKIIEHSVSQREYSWKELLLSIGPAFLLMLLVLDIQNLRDVTIFPQNQDGLEYQIFARNIFVRGDVFLTETPPRAYKILFPYLVGIVHTFFGQSASAQLFLNAWCAILSSAIILNLMKHNNISASIALLISLALPLILCLPSSYIYYYRFGLIEPVAILFLLLTCYFAIKQKIGAMFITGMLTVLLRLDYLGLVLAAIMLTSPPILGSTRAAWKQFSSWFRVNAKLIVAYALAICFPPLLIISGYFLLTPHYTLNFSDTYQVSPASISEGLMRVVIGGNLNELKTKFAENFLDASLTVFPLILGFLIALATIFFRKGIFEKIDLRWALLIPSILPAYLVVRPAAYFPRFSFSILPFDLVMIGSFLYYYRVMYNDFRSQDLIEVRVNESR